MSLTGILLDVSGSMEKNIGSGIDEEGGPWARSIFKVIDDLIEHDLSLDNRVFALGVGAKTSNKIFDVITTVQRIEKIPESIRNKPGRVNINKILDILERNGARAIRKWSQIPVIQKEVNDDMAALVRSKLESDKQFRKYFVNECLPPACRNWVQETEEHSLADSVRSIIALPADAIYSSVGSTFRTATADDIKQVVEKVKEFLICSVGSHSIFSVQDASRIIRGCVDEKDFSKERSQELLEKVEPFIYGGTPLYQSLKMATHLLEDGLSHSLRCENQSLEMATNLLEDENHNKLLFVLSDGEAGDRGTCGSTEEIVSNLKAKVNVVCCFISTSTNVTPKRLYSKVSSDWESGAKFLFSLSSKLETRLLPRTIFIKRGWIIDINDNETKLFMHVNHPDNLKEACDMARDVVCCQDALSELLVSVDLDIYITNRNITSIKAKSQVGETCYAYASATVLHLAMKRILGREGGHPDFETLLNEIIKKFGIRSALISPVLTEMCRRCRLHCKQVEVADAKKAIVEKRLVVATFLLTDDEWEKFRAFYTKNPTGILTQKEIDLRKRNSDDCELTGHAVVLTSYNSKCFILMNSWGHNWADMGFFRVQNAKVLGLEFIDVYWKLEDLTEGEKNYYDEHGHQAARRLMDSLQGLQTAEYMCPKCTKKSLVTEFTGTLLEVECPKCSQKFSANDNAGNILALNVYLTSLSR